MAIMGMVLGLVGMRGPLRSERATLDAAARELVASLQLARSRAIAQNRVVALRVGGDSYSLDGEAPRPLPRAIAVSAGGTIAFAPSGSSSGGVITVQGSSDQRAVRVAWLTGRIWVTAKL